MIEEIPIYSDEAEKAVLGCILVSAQDSCQLAVDALKPTDFFVVWHRTLFVLMSGMWAANKPIDLVTVSQAIRDSGQATDSEIFGSLADLCGAWSNLKSLSGYIDTVKVKAAAREMQVIGIRLIEAAIDGKTDHGYFIDEAARRLDQLAVGMEVSVISGPDPWDDFYALMAKQEDDPEEQILATGYGQFDDAVRIRGGHVIVIGAVQKHGKSSLALNFAVRWWEQQIPGCVCSLEMGLHDLQSLIMSNVSGITRDAMEARKLSPERLDALFKSVAQAKKWPYAIYERPSLRAREFRMLAREQARRGAKFIVLDYFQLMEAEQKGFREERHLELEEMMRSIKCTALETGLAVILLSQLNAKSVEGKADNRPSLANLRGTGAIAQDADVVMLLSEPRPQERHNGMRKMVGAIEANRRGAECDIGWFFDGAHARFLEAT